MNEKEIHSEANRTAEFASGLATTAPAKGDDTEYINDGPSGQRCEFIFLVDEHVNLVTKPGSVRVFSARGKKCGLQRDSGGTYCFWHTTDPEKFSKRDFRKELQQLVQENAYLGGTYISGEGYSVSYGPVDLSGLNLQGAFLAGAFLEGSCLSGTNLREAHLQQAFAAYADLSCADLTDAHLWGTDFQSSKLAMTELNRAEIDGNTRLDGVAWSKDYVLPNEKLGKFDSAETTYRMLKQHRQGAGDYHAAGEFYFREMECKRKQLPVYRQLLYTLFLKSTCGYGERPTWSLRWAAAIILLWGLLIFPLAGIHNPDGTTTSLSWAAAPAAFQRGLSLSLITFATLGYGNRYPAGPAGEFLAGFEALLGMLMVSIFVVSFAKQVIRG